MPLDKHKSRTTGARDLISSLINIASFLDVPFQQPQLANFFFGTTVDLEIFYAALSHVHHVRKISLVEILVRFFGFFKDVEYEVLCFL